MKSSIFDQLIEAIRSYQTGVVHIRAILAPLFAEDTADEEKQSFFTQSQGDPLGVSQIQTCMENTGLHLPEDLADALLHLDFVVAPVGDGVVTQVPTEGVFATPEAAIAAAVEKTPEELAAELIAAADAAAIGH